MAVLAAQDVRGVSGKTITYSAAAGGGDRAPIGDGLFLLVKNGSGVSVTVTLDAVGTAFNAGAIPDTAIAVPATSDRMIPLRAEYQSASDGLAGIAYSATTTVTVAVIQA